MIRRKARFLKTSAERKLNLTLRKDGYAGESSKYSMYLRTKDGKYARQIVVAAYTGRVRIVRDA